jgi:hypothetical protein
MSRKPAAENCSRLGPRLRAPARCAEAARDPIFMEPLRHYAGPGPYRGDHGCDGATYRGPREHGGMGAGGAGAATDNAGDRLPGHRETGRNRTLKTA